MFPEKKRQPASIVEGARRFVRPEFCRGDLPILQNMVRIMTGTLLEVGFGKKEPEDMARIIEAKDRKAAGYTAPAQGLCLMKVDY